MDKIVYFDYCAFAVLLLLLLTTVTRKMTRGKANHYFFILIVVSFLTALFDVCAINLDLLGPGNVTWKYIFHTLYMLVHTAMIPCYITYLFSLTDTWHMFYQRRWYSVLVFLPYLITVALLAVNPFNNVIFYFDEVDMYTRNTGFIAIYIVPAIYILFGCSYLIKYRKMFTRQQLLILISPFPVQALVSLIQFMYPNHVIELFLTAINLMFISMSVQKPEEVLDSETGLLNYTAYVTMLERSQISKKPMHLVMINIMNYKILSEMLGHEGINLLLNNVAIQLSDRNRHMHTNAEIYYIGQGKYRMVIDHKNLDRTEELAEAVNIALKPIIPLNQMDVNIMGQICITKWPEDIDNIDSLLIFGNQLNEHVYTGKVLYATDLFKRHNHELMRDIDHVIERALIYNQFEVYYQPIYSVKEKRFNSAEALLRLKDDKYGFIPPDIFIAAAEKNGAIHKIGAFVVDEVCKFISSDEYKELGIDYIEVNLSVAQCMHSNLAKDILETLEKYSVRPDQINLEITETAASYAQNIMAENLRLLTEAGINFSLDDYGTGYSNIYRIASLPLQMIKLDKSFTNIAENPKLLTILENTVRMIKDMELQIVVEGIETEDMVHQFTSLECEYIQGYYYSKPIPRNDFVEFIRTAQAS